MVKRVTDSVTKATVSVAVATAARSARALSTVAAIWVGREFPKARSASVLNSASKAAPTTQAAGIKNRLLPSPWANWRRNRFIAGSYEDGSLETRNGSALTLDGNPA